MSPPAVFVRVSRQTTSQLVPSNATAGWLWLFGGGADGQPADVQGHAGRRDPRREYVAPGRRVRDQVGNPNVLPDDQRAVGDRTPRRACRS